MKQLTISFINTASLLNYPKTKVMQTINTTRFEAQISAINKKIVKGKARNRYAAIRKVYALQDSLNSIKSFINLAR